MKVNRPFVTAVVVAAAALLAPGVAHAEPPSNDDFDNALVIPSLPFGATVDTTDATTGADDPLTSCYGRSMHSVWFSFTAPRDGLVTASASSDGYSPILSAYTGSRGALTAVPGFCTAWSGPADTMPVTAGTTYHFLMRQDYYGGRTTFDAHYAEPAPNDDITSAIDVSLGETHSGDLALASGAPGEVVPSCEPVASQSAWYRYVPQQTGWVSVEPQPWTSPAISVHRADLSEVDCVWSGESKSGVFKAEVGQAYYVRIADDVDDAAAFTVRFGVAPALNPALGVSPNNASVFSTVYAYPYSGDPLQRPLTSGEVRFGDGTSAPLTGSPLTHRYDVDGTYLLELTGATSDGRSGSATTLLTVETHDVTLTSLVVPAGARAGQTKPITVTVGNTRYPETVKVDLYKETPDGWSVHLGSQTQYTPVRQVEFPFAYTYSAADAAAGSVTFRAVVSLPDHYGGDANPADNRTTATTRVRPPTTTGAR